MRRRLATLGAAVVALGAVAGGALVSQPQPHARVWTSQATRSHPTHASRRFASFSPTGYSVTINWTAIPFASRTGYLVTEDGTQVADVTSTSYTFTNLACGATHTLGVQAHDGSGGTGQLLTTSYTTPSCPGHSGPTVNFFVAQSAAGSGNGSSCSNAAAVSTLSTATQWTPGNVIGLCGTITSQVSAQGNGTSTNPITVYWEPGASLSQPVCPNTGCFASNGHTNLTLDGGNNGVSIQSTANGTNLANHSTTTGIYAPGCTGCTFENLTIANLYVMVAGDPAIASGTPDHTQMDGIKYGGSNTILANNTIHDTGWAVWYDGSSGESNIEVYGNYIYNIDHGIAIAPTSGSYTNMDVFDNHLGNMANWDDGGCCHHDPIHCFGPATGNTWNGLYLYNNLFDGGWGTSTSSATFIEGQPDGTACATASSSLYIFNNVALPNLPAATAACCGLFGDTASGGAFNNTMRDPQSKSNCMGAGGFGANGSLTMLQNNLMDACDNEISGVAFGATGAIKGTYSSGSPDYDAFIEGGSSGSNSFSGTGPSGSSCSGTFTQFATWRTCMAAESHGATWASDATAGVNPDGSLTGPSPLAGAGINETSLCSSFPSTPVNVQAACETTYAGPPVGTSTAGVASSGSARPSTGGWNIGAY